MIRQRIVGVGVFLLLFIGQGLSQKSTFEIASIKINKSGSLNSSIGPLGDRFVATNVTLGTLLIYAYRPIHSYFGDSQIIGAPQWAKVERFDIQAKLEGDAPVLPGEQTNTKLRSLLEDRFQLRVHRDTRDVPVYNLVLTKKGPKLSEDQTPPDRRHSLMRVISQGTELGPVPRGQLTMITGPTTTTIIGTAIPIHPLLEMLQPQSDRIIVDNTGFDRLIDVHLEFNQDVAASLPGVEGVGIRESGATDPNGFGPSLFTAIQEVGLKLKPGKAPMEVLVIDSVQQPSEN
jgi:uncharacterized protein (TIGR03435 family)